MNSYILKRKRIYFVLGGSWGLCFYDFIINPHVSSSLILLNLCSFDLPAGSRGQLWRSIEGGRGTITSVGERLSISSHRPTCGGDMPWKGGRRAQKFTNRIVSSLARKERQLGESKEFVSTTSGVETYDFGTARWKGLYWNS